jgi:hypothetical protein
MVRRKRFMVGAALAVVLLFVPATGSSAQGRGAASSEYAAAVRAALQRQWEAASYDAGLEPGSSCAARIVQMPGGEVLSVDFFPDCDFDEAGRSGIVEAVRRSEPLPYQGFENVHQREIRIVFRAASVGARQARAATLAAEERAGKDRAESDLRWQAAVESRRRRDEYSRRCSSHLQGAVPKVPLRRPAVLVVTIDRSGKVVGVASIRKDSVDRRLVAALGAAAPCEPAPADLAVEAGTFEIGPIVFGLRSD